MKIPMPGGLLREQADGSEQVSAVMGADGRCGVVAECVQDAYGVDLGHPVGDRIEDAHRWWEEHGCPGSERFGLTVTEQAQWAWLDSPADVLPLRR